MDLADELIRIWQRTGRLARLEYETRELVAPRSSSMPEPGTRAVRLPTLAELDGTEGNDDEA